MIQTFTEPQIVDAELEDMKARIRAELNGGRKVVCGCRDGGCGRCAWIECVRDLVLDEMEKPPVD